MLLKEKDRKEIQKLIGELPREVKLVMFTQDFECDYCSQTRELLEELTTLAPQLKLEVHDFAEEKRLADGYGIDKIPAIIVQGEEDRGIRFFGVPAGYEFANLIGAIQMVAAGDSGLEESTREALARIKEKVLIQVFVTPT